MASSSLIIIIIIPIHGSFSCNTNQPRLFPPFIDGIFLYLVFCSLVTAFPISSYSYFYFRTSRFLCYIVRVSTSSSRCFYSSELNRVFCWYLLLFWFTVCALGLDCLRLSFLWIVNKYKFEWRGCRSSKCKFEWRGLSFILMQVRMAGYVVHLNASSSVVHLNASSSGVVFRSSKCKFEWRGVSFI